MSPERRSPFLLRFLKGGLKLALFGLTGALIGTGVGILGAAITGHAIGAALSLQAPLSTVIGGATGTIMGASSN